MRIRHLVLLISAFCFVNCATEPAEPRQAMFPSAEWDRAESILMFAPGEELFDGVIHPSAALFEDYFNVDSAAAEHLRYKKMLESNGIIVYDVRDVLREMNIDTLITLASQTLVYNVDDVIPSDSASFGYSYISDNLRKMSREDLVRIILFQPEIILHSTDNNTNVEADYRHHPLMNLYFTRDQSITTPKGHIMCRMNSSQRAPETRIIRACYEQLGLKPVFEVTGDGRLEGGDYIPAGNIAFIGCGMRTNIEAIRQMMDADVFGHDTVVVVNDHLRWQMEMHLDTHFNIIDKNLCTMQASRINAPEGAPEYCTADIYARAKGAAEYSLIRENVGFVDFVKERGFQIIPIGREDELHYANNYLTVAPRHIMAVGGQSEKFRKALADAGVIVEWIPLENLINGYGAAHCMTQVLRRYSGE